MEIYLVGGAVRDTLLGETPRERDWVVVGSSVDEMERLGFRQVGRDFPVFIHPDSGEEYALARTERKSGHGYHGFVVHADPAVTLEQDLERRDLTINAIAQAADGTLIDPFNGQRDLRDGRLRHVSPAFSEDPVRILRIARFAARFARWGFRVAHSTHAVMKAMVASGEVDHLVPERVWKEMERALGEDRPRRFFEVLRHCGALARIVPELDRLFSTPQPHQHHPEGDAGEHSLRALDAACGLSERGEVRFAALMHDLGKGDTPDSLLPRHHGHEGRSAKRVRELCQRLRSPNSYSELAVAVARYHSHAHRAFELRPETLVDTLGALDAWRRPERLALFVAACHADARGRGEPDAPYPQGEYLLAAHRAASAISGGELAREGLTGKALGEALRRRRCSAVARIKARFTDSASE